MWLYYHLSLFFVHFGVKTIFTNNCGVRLSIGWACKFIFIDVEIELSITYELKMEKEVTSITSYRAMGGLKFKCQEIRMARKKCLGPKCCA